jgi:hypothetical protein
MDVSTVIDPWLAWFADQIGLLSNLPPAYIALAAIVPFLIALMSRDLLASLWTALFALGAISLCGTQQINWGPVIATFGTMASFLVASAAVIRQRQSRVLRDELRLVCDELGGLKERLQALEAYERRKIMQWQRNPTHSGLDSGGLLALAEDSRSKISIAPK